MSHTKKVKQIANDNYIICLMSKNRLIPHELTALNSKTHSILLKQNFHKNTW